MLQTRVASCFRVRQSSLLGLFGAAVMITGCADTAKGPRGALADDLPPEPGELVFRSQVQPVTRAEDALPRVFIPPFQDCRDPLPGVLARG